MAAILTAAIIITCIPIAAPSVSYAADAADYTSATDIELNQINIVTIEGTILDVSHIEKGSKIDREISSTGVTIYEK